MNEAILGVFVRSGYPPLRVQALLVDNEAEGDATVCSRA
jgi:hypothetical protein